MPCGGGDTGLNVWVENGDILLYMSRGGTFDEHNTMLKLGRVRLRLSPNPFEGKTFHQELHLKDGFVEIKGENGVHRARIHVWADVFSPAAHVDVVSSKPMKLKASYESWRTVPRITKGKENNANSWKWAPPVPVVNHPDNVAFHNGGVMFYHKNSDTTVFDIVVKQQAMESVKQEMYNPLKHLIFGGMMSGKGMQPVGTSKGRYMDTDFQAWHLVNSAPVKRQSLDLVFYNANEASEKHWIDSLSKRAEASPASVAAARKRSQRWWHAFWNRSHIFLDAPDSSSVYQAGRNYQLFRYMLACNAYGAWPTKFNGGLFTYDPSSIDSSMAFSPDFRNWGGGTHTAQNQRLVYWPMLKNGDFDMMDAQFDFYRRILKNAELRSKVYWNHDGACFSEQIENFGLPNPAEYNWKRPASADKGIEYNKWLEYEWDTVLEFCLMMIELHNYSGMDMRGDIPFISSCLAFFDQHYQMEALKRTGKAFDAQGKLIIYPGSGAETYKMARNPASTVAGLRTLTEHLLALPTTYLTNKEREHWSSFLLRIPELSYRKQGGKTTIAPAWEWERINNTESPQLYPVYPWGRFGLGKAGLDTAINTYLHDADVLKFRSHVGWKQDNIFAARLGLREDAARYTVLKLKDSGRRFPAFWGPGFDWTPDHNWGGSGMIGLQEMLLQCVGETIYLLPALPASWNVDFKLHATGNTTVDVVYKDGKLQKLKVIPASRKKDVVIMSAVAHQE